MIADDTERVGVLGGGLYPMQNIRCVQVGFNKISNHDMVEKIRPQQKEIK